MGLLVAFAPFLVFALVDRFVTPLTGLIAAALTAAALLLRDVLIAHRPVKILEACTMLLFGGLSVYVLVVHPLWSIVEIRLIVDAGLLLIVVASLALRRPFTLAYAREQTPPEIWSKPAFVQVNYVITGVWALAFAIVVAADVLMAFATHIPTWVGIMVTVAALMGALKFTGWYPVRSRSRLPA